ncbi:MAG: hypothetical protein Q4F34_05795 [Prevotellaceae bacterium]|nr:hypothetical protein [Prevotellaceae bacterium]
MTLATMMCFMSCQESLPQRCAREAKTYTEKNCPAKIAECITLDSIVFAEVDSTMQYFYSVTDLLDSAELMAAHYEVYRTALRKDIRNSTNLKPYKDEKFKFQYVYLSKKKPGKALLSLKYNYDDYK